MFRPGGTISDLTIMMLACASMYSVVLSVLGLVTLAVTPVTDTCSVPLFFRGIYIP